MAAGRPWVRLLSCNPAEVKDPRIAPFSSGYPAADRSAWPAFLDEVRRTHGDMWADFDAFCRDNGAGGLAWGEQGPDFMHESPFLNLYSYPREADYEPRERRSVRPGTSSIRRSARPRRRGSCLRTLADARRRAHLPVAREPRVGRRRAHAAARGRAGPHGPPRDRVQGSARGPDHAPRQHDRRRVPAPAGSPADGRPRDHPRRQQHRRGVVPPRQADDRAAAVLGPGRQRPAGGRDGLRAPPRDVRLRGCELAGRDRRAPRRHGRCGRDSPPSRRGCRRARGTVRAADLIERVAVTHAPVTR